MPLNLPTIAAIFLLIGLILLLLTPGMIGTVFLIVGAVLYVVHGVMARDWITLVSWLIVLLVWVRPWLGPVGMLR